MRVPLSWLQEYVSLPPLDRLLERLTEIGHMVDAPLELASEAPIVSLEIRQNRPDCLSILGIAREVGAAFNQPVSDRVLAELPCEAQSSTSQAEGYVCFLHIRGAALDRLPDILLRNLEYYGQRPVTPLVDLANYVMVELGQPLHVYSAEHIDPSSAGARSARNGERLSLIDGRSVVLSQDDLVIADHSGPLALAGIMGGGDSAVTTSSGDIVVEAGAFRPHLVRRTARRHQLATEASLRSSKLLPPELVTVALARFLALLIQYGQAEAVELWQTGSMPRRASQPINLAYKDIERIGGVRIPPAQAVQTLAALGFEAAPVDAGRTIVATPPWWRTDVEHPADLVEELLRIAGYSRIPLATLPAMPRAALAAGAWEQEEQIRNLLCAWGYDEVILDTFLMDNGGGLGDRADALQVENPPAGQPTLRPSLLPNIVSAARFLPFLIPQRRLFEIGHTFHRNERAVEQRAAGWIVLQGSGAPGWNLANQPPDFYSIKAEAEAMLQMLGISVVPDTAGPVPFPFVPGKSCRFTDDRGEVAGYAGMLDHRAYGVTPVQVSFGVEIYLPSPSMEREQPPRNARREVASFDLSLSIAPGANIAALQRAIGEALGADLVDVRLIDVYAGDGKEAHPRSVTFRVVYAAAQGEPNPVWQAVGAEVERRMDARVRA
jgi:phenylalanyl-tRNA synthetase beta chain